MTNPRCGSVLLFCIAMVAALAVLAYGFIRVVQLQREGGTNANIHLLAREAALTGVNHAAEQLLRDFTNERFTRLDSPGVRAFAAHDFPYTGSNAPNLQDVTATTGGAPMLNVNDMPITDGFDYVLWSNAGGGHLAYANGYMNETGRGRFHEPDFHNLPTAAAYDSAATPASYSASASDPTVQAGRPPVRFGAPYPGALDRSAGLFYDSELRRVDDPDPRAARDKARYRLRYAITTLDLEGMLLVNGDQGVHHGMIKTADPGAVARDDTDPTAARPFIRPADVEPVRRVVRNMHRLPAIIDAQMGWGRGEGSNRFLSGGPTSGVAAEHVFIGRGSTSNVNRRADSGFAPTTFPYMYRTPGQYARFAPLAPSISEGAWPGPEPYTVTSGVDAVTGRISGNEPIPPKSGTTHPTFIHMLMGPQFSFFDYLHATYGDGADGVDARGLATLGRFTPFGRGVSRREPGESITRYRANVDTPWCLNLLTTTPRMVYSMVAGYMPPGAICVQHPVRPDAPASYVLYGPCPLPLNPAPFAAPFAHPTGSTVLYLTPGTGVFRVGDAVTVGGGDGEHRVTAVTVHPAGMPLPGAVTVLTISPGLRSPGNDGAAVEAVLPGEYAPQRTRDLFVRQLSPAFRYEAPKRLAAGANGAIQPDYHVDDFWVTDPPSTTAPYRGPEARYPGVLAFNGVPPAAVHTIGMNDVRRAWRNDGLGHHLRSVQVAAGVRYDATGRWKAVKSRGRVADDPGTHAQTSYWRSSSWTHVGTYDGTVAHLDTQGEPVINVKLGTHPDSIWEVIGQAMGATASTLQGQWYQYVNDVGQAAPDAWFNGGPWPGARATSIRDVDALFVRNLGSDPARPNDPTPVAIWYGSGGRLATATPTWNLAALNDLNPRCLALAVNPGRMPTGSPVPDLPICSLNHPSEPGYAAADPTYTATERTQAAELIINDFRMSFFGASPQYDDDFRVLDLNGDGKAACSAYPSHPTATVTERAHGIDQYTTDVDPGTGIALRAVAADPGTTFFSSTGTFILGKSRFWRILVRGEVWDNVLNVTVDRAQLDAVLCIDPVESAHEVGPGMKDPGAGQYSTHVISQSWVFNGTREFLPKRY